MIGQTVAHYRVLDKLGAGGMGVVYRALDVHLNRFVALKLLPPDRVSDPERRRRFVQEARTASALNHPNIVTVHDISQADGVTFIAMECVEGKTLDQLIGRKGLRLNDALRYATQIAAALAKAHAVGVVHRDLKPTNIMVTSERLVKVLDFGLAKLTEPDTATENESTRTLKGATEEGTILGTVAYMSPEQAEGKRLDARSDIFSFGSVLYEMVTGRRAFEGDTNMSTLSAILAKEPPTIAAVREGVPADLGKLIARCLRKDPERRIQHMDDVKLALEDLINEPTTAVTAKAVRGDGRKRTLMWTLVASAALAIAAFLFKSSWRTVRSPELRTRVVPITAYPGTEDCPSLSPDGSQVAFSWDGVMGDNVDIYVKLADTGTPLRLTTNPAGDTSPAWSPDGRLIAFLRTKPGKRAEVIVVPALGGPERILAEVAEPGAGWSLPGANLSWLPDSRHLVIMDRRAPEEPFGLFSLSVQTREKRPLLAPAAKSVGDGNPAVSPDGHRLAFIRSPSYIVSDLYVVRLSDDLTATGEPSRVTFDNRRVNTPAWTPDGTEIIFPSNRDRNFGLWRISPDEQRVATPVTAAQSATALSVSRSPTGGALRIAYVDSRAATRDIWKLPLSSPVGQPTRSFRIISSTRDDLSPAYSPNGQTIAFASDRSGSYEIWVSKSDGTNLVQLTSFDGPVTDHPAWSPDGNRIAFHSRVEGQADIYVVNSAGGQPLRMTEEPAEDVAPSWSRDAAWIYFGSRRSGQHQVWKVPERGGKAVQVTTNGGLAAFESPDGQYLYYTKARGVTNLWKSPVAGGPETKVVDELFYLNFAMTSDGIYFISEDLDGGHPHISVLSFRGGMPRRIAPTASEQTFPLAGTLAITSIDVSPDRQSLLYARWERGGRDLMLLENFR